MTKAMEENANVGSKMAPTQNFLGEEDHKAHTSKALLLDMLTTKNFSKNCEVICINDDETNDDYGKKRKAVDNWEIWSNGEESLNCNDGAHDSDDDQENDRDL